MHPLFLHAALVTGLTLGTVCALKDLAFNLCDGHISQNTATKIIRFSAAPLVVQILLLFLIELNSPRLILSVIIMTIAAVSVGKIILVAFKKRHFDEQMLQTLLLSHSVIYEIFLLTFWGWGRDVAALTAI